MEKKHKIGIVVAGVVIAGLLAYFLFKPKSAAKPALVGPGGIPKNANSTFVDSTAMTSAKQVYTKAGTNVYSPAFDIIYTFPSAGTALPVFNEGSDTYSVVWGATNNESGLVFKGDVTTVLGSTGSATLA